MRRAVSLSAQRTLFWFGTAIAIAFITWMGSNHAAQAINYGAGTYGTCTYGTCNISLTTSGSIAVNVTPAAGATRCTVSSDSVTASTDSSTGYTVTLTDTDTTNSLSGPTSIAATSGTPAVPIVLAANTWGFRVDNISGFGAGPTSIVANGGVPTAKFAAVPLSTGTPATIRTTSTADSSTVSTPVWFGVCANTSLQSGSYTDSVTYTAVIN
jgi:hypothetical protein